MGVSIAISYKECPASSAPLPLNGVDLSEMEGDERLSVDQNKDRYQKDKTVYDNDDDDDDDDNNNYEYQPSAR
jgi:hypothetical protein